MFIVLSRVLHVIKLDTLLAEFVKCPLKGTPCPWEPAWKCYQRWKNFSLLNSRSKLHYRPTIKFDNCTVDRVVVFSKSLIHKNLVLPAGLIYWIVKSVINALQTLSFGIN